MLLLEGGELLCPLSGQHGPGALLVDSRTGRIVALRPDPDDLPGSVRRLDCSGCLVAPGLVDLCSDFAEPGEAWREDLVSGSEAAAAGGFTTVVLSPATHPPLDEPSTIEALLARAQAAPGARIEVAGALTRGLAGRELAELGMLAEAGCVAFSDGGAVIADAVVLRRALQYAVPQGLAVLLRPGEPSLEERGVMHEGEVSMRLGLHGIPEAAEELGVARAVALARITGARVHLTHLTTARGLRLVEQALADGVHVSAAVPARSLVLTDAWIEESGYDTAGRLLPPLRPEADRAAMVVAARRRLVVGADHQPCSRVEKELEFDYARPGAVGLETAAAAAWTAMGGEARCWVEALSTRPAAVLGRRAALEVGAVADVVVFDPQAEGVVGAPQRSRGVNEPLRGRRMRGAVRATLVGGRVVYGPVARVD